MRVVSSRHCRFGLKNVCALGGVRLVPSPPLFRLAMPSRRCGGGGRPRPLPRAGASPRLLPPSLWCSSRRLRARVPFCGLWPPLRSALRLARRSAPSLARAGLRGAAGRPRAPPPWARARCGRGRRCPPAPPPSGVRSLSLPRGGLLPRLSPRLVAPPSPPRGWGWCCRRCGGGAAAPSCSASGAGGARSVVLGACPPLLRAALRVRGLSCTFRARFPADVLRCLSRICRLALSRMLFRD